MTLSYRCDGYNDCGCDGDDCDEDGCDGLSIGKYRVLDVHVPGCRHVQSIAWYQWTVNIVVWYMILSMLHTHARYRVYEEKMN